MKSDQLHSFERITDDFNTLLLAERETVFTVCVPLSLFAQHTPIHNDSRTRHEIARSAGQKQNSSSQVLRRAPSFSRCSRKNDVLVFWAFPDCVRQRRAYIPVILVELCLTYKSQATGEGVDVPWAYAVDLDPLLCQFIAERFGHLQHATFRSSVGRDVVHADERSHRTYVDDLAWLLEGQQTLCDFLRGDKASFEVDVQDLGTDGLVCIQRHAVA